MTTCAAAAAAAVQGCEGRDDAAAGGRARLCRKAHGEPVSSLQKVSHIQQYIYKTPLRE